MIPLVSHISIPLSTNKKSSFTTNNDMLQFEEGLSHHQSLPMIQDQGINHIKYLIKDSLIK